MSTKDEPMPPEARKAARLAIATHLTHALLTGEVPQPDDVIVDRAYSLADQLLAKSDL